MRREHWQKIEEIFHAALEYHGREREEYLQRACKDDPATLAELVELLKEHENPSASLLSPILDIGLQMFEEPESGGRTGESIGHLRIGHLIGRGGMGEIYAAEDMKSGRKVAIKLINELVSSDPERIRRFQKEARAALRVSHPNVAKLYELCEIDGENLIVMEFVDGTNLRQHMAEAISLNKALDIAIQIASALAAAHAVGVVHRDIKPENIIITPDGNVKVLDFGLAKLVSPIGGAIHVEGGENVKLTVDMSTELGALIGTPAYMSPEQIRGADVDTQTDIWSLGVLLYEMLTGQLPFRGATKIDSIAATLLSGHSPVQLGKIAGLDKINAVLRKALRKEKTARYREVGELLTDLKAIKNDVESRSDEHFESQGFRKHSAWKFVAGTVLLSTLLIAVLPASRRLVSSYLFAPPRTTAPHLLPITDGLVSYWPADGNANDVVGGNSGELLNGATYRSGVSGQAFSLDGVNGYIEVPDSPSLSITGPLTLEATIYVDSNAVQQAIIEKYDEPEINGYFLRLNASGKLEAAVCNRVICGPEAAKGAMTVSTGTWHRVAAVYDGKSVKIYLDGILDANLPTTLIPTDGEASLKIGARGDDANMRFRGLIDEVKIYNRALSSAEILPIGGLVSYWPGNGNALDVVGSNNGQLFNGAAYRPGVSEQAFSFDNVDGYFQAPTAGFPTGSGSRTMAMWVTIDEIQTPNSFFGGYGRFGSFDQAYLLTTVRGQDLAITNWGEGPGLMTLEPGRWYHIASTTDADSTSLYVNGILVKAQKMKIDTPVDTYFYSGRIPGNLGDFRRLKGAVDEIAIYDLALTAQEIQNLFKANTPPNG